MLEEAIKENTAAVRELIAALEKTPTATQEKPAKKPQAASTSSKEKIAASSETAPASKKDTLKEPTEYTDVQTAITALAQAKGRDAAVAVLADFGVKKGAELMPGQYAEVVASAQEAANA